MKWNSLKNVEYLRYIIHHFETYDNMLINESNAKYYDFYRTLLLKKLNINVELHITNHGKDGKNYILTKVR